MAGGRVSRPSLECVPGPFQLVTGSVSGRPPVACGDSRLQGAGMAWSLTRSPASPRQGAVVGGSVKPQSSMERQLVCRPGTPDLREDWGS